MMLLKNLSEEKPEVLEPLAKYSVDILSKKYFSHYWHENATKMLINLFKKNKEIIPKDLQDNIDNILEEEHRHNVTKYLSSLNDDINSQ